MRTTVFSSKHHNQQRTPSTSSGLEALLKEKKYYDAIETAAKVDKREIRRGRTSNWVHKVLDNIKNLDPESLKNCESFANFLLRSVEVASRSRKQGDVNYIEEAKENQN